MVGRKRLRCSAVVCALKRRGIKCGSTADEREAGVVDGPGEWAFSILPIPWQIGGTEEAVRERVPPTGIGPSNVRNRILAIQGFEDMKEQAQDTMIRDKFIAGQRQCALHRQLDGFAQDTPIGEIVDSCRVWESHSESDRIFTVNCESDVGNQPGDSRTRERRKLVVNVQPKVAEIEKQEPMVGNQEDPSVLGLLVNQLLQSTQGEILRRDRPSVMGPVCFSYGDGGHRINRCPQVNTDFPFLPAGWSMNMDNGQYRAKRMNQRLAAEEPGNEQRSEREGQPLGPPEIKASLTQAGFSAEISNGNTTGGFRRKIVSGTTGRPIVRSFCPWKRSRGRPEIRRDQPVSVPPKWASDRRALRRRSPEFGPGDAAD